MAPGASPRSDHPAVVVVGGGISGLAAAYELTLRGIDFLLLEAGPTLGGLIRTEHADGFTIDAGPDSLLIQKPAAVELCEELGLGPRLMPTRPPRTAFVLRGTRLHALPSPSVLGIPTSIKALSRYDLLDWPARLRVGLEPALPRRPQADESVASFFRRRFGRASVALIAEPLLGGIHAGDVEQLSIASVFPRLIEAEARSGSVMRGLRPPARPAADGMFRALRGGMSEMVDALRAALPADAVRTGTAVSQLRRSGGTWELAAGPARHAASSVVLALPAHAAADLLRDTDGPAAALCATVPYASTVSVALGFPRDAVAHPLAGSGFVVARRHSAARITACTWVSSKWEDRAPQGHVLLRAFAGGTHDPGVVERTDEELIAMALGDLTPVLGLSQPPVLTRVFRSRRAGAQHNVGHRARMAELKARLARSPGLFVAGSGFESIGIPDCVANGRRVAAAAADYVRMGP